jgi:D-3-phosphoglycerate dehydrogenase
MSAYLTTGAITNALNMPSLTAEEAKRLKPYMTLAEQLGSFAGQLTHTGLTSVTIEYEGLVADVNTRPLTQVALCGLLSPMLVTTERGPRSVSGTLFGGTKPRIVEIKGISIEAALTPHMLYITNEDKPGFIGALGTTLGDAGVNIATFHLGRAEQGKDAIALLELDGPIDAKTLEKVRALPHTMQAEALRF